MNCCCKVILKGFINFAKLYHVSIFKIDPTGSLSCSVALYVAYAMQVVRVQGRALQQEQLTVVVLLARLLRE